MRTEKEVTEREETWNNKLKPVWVTFTSICASQPFLKSVVPQYVFTVFAQTHLKPGSQQIYGLISNFKVITLRYLSNIFITCGRFLNIKCFEKRMLKSHSRGLVGNSFFIIKLGLQWKVLQRRTSSTLKWSNPSVSYYFELDIRFIIHHESFETSPLPNVLHLT